MKTDIRNKSVKLPCKLTFVDFTFNFFVWFLLVSFVYGICVIIYRATTNKPTYNIEGLPAKKEHMMGNYTNSTTLRNFYY